MNIQWYPGHMTKTMRALAKDISLVDIVLELLDARIPYSSKNPDIAELARRKKHIVILNKADLADEAVTSKWKRFYESAGLSVVAINSVSGGGTAEVMSAALELMKVKFGKDREKGRVSSITRAMVVGVPNVGKSTLINRYAGRQAAAAADKPGVTRGRQWIKIGPGFELLDTPGVLWPKFDDPNVGIKLAITGAVSDNIPDMVLLSFELIKLLGAVKPDSLKARYGVSIEEGSLPEVVLERIGEARGFKLKGGLIDEERAAITLLDEFRGGKLGRISLEEPMII